MVLIRRSMPLKWVVAEDRDPQLVQDLVTATELPPNVIKILISRDMDDPVAIKRFLTQLKRGSQADYNGLDECFRQRYAPGVNQLFADTKKDSESRRLLRQQVAEDMYHLIRLFADRPEHAHKDSYKALKRIPHEQCDVREESDTAAPTYYLCAWLC